MKTPSGRARLGGGPPVLDFCAVGRDDRLGAKGQNFVAKKNPDILPTRRTCVVSPLLAGCR